MTLKNRLVAAGITGVVGLAALFIGQHEGEIRDPYMDLGGVGTVCFGSTTYEDRTHSAQECLNLLVRDVRVHNAGVRKAVNRPMPASVEAAMTSAAYNAGVGAFRSSPMLPLLIKGYWGAACNALEAPVQTKYGVAKGWRATVKGRPVRGLENRRKAEATLCRRDL